jgi:UDP-N-acetylglucosamine 2-epimerase
MPVAPPELTAEVTVEGEGLAAVREAAGALAREAGPDTVSVAGDRAEVLRVTSAAVEAALDAGAEGVRVRFEPTPVA